MGTKIYFPEINAEATVEDDLKRGGTASVCNTWNGEAYIGQVTREKFTTRKPAGWDRNESVRRLHHIPAGGFAFFIE